MTRMPEAMASSNWACIKLLVIDANTRLYSFIGELARLGTGVFIPTAITKSASLAALSGKGSDTTPSNNN